jgi:hypothetical protein
MLPIHAMMHSIGHCHSMTILIEVDQNCQSCPGQYMMPIDDGGGNEKGS